MTNETGYWIGVIIAVVFITPLLHVSVWAYIMGTIIWLAGMASGAYLEREHG